LGKVDGLRMMRRWLLFVDEVELGLGWREMIQMIQIPFQHLMILQIDSTSLYLESSLMSGRRETGV